jgi:hypothetical protein
MQFQRSSNPEILFHQAFLSNEHSTPASDSIGQRRATIPAAQLWDRVSHASPTKLCEGCGAAKSAKVHLAFLALELFALGDGSSGLARGAEGEGGEGFYIARSGSKFDLLVICRGGGRGGCCT